MELLEQTLLEQHFNAAFAAPEGMKKLRELILTLAMQGKLVPQDPADQPASELLEEIEAKKRRLMAEGKIKAPKPLPPIEADEVPYQPPEGWAWVRLGDFGSWKSGSTPSRTNSKYYGGHIPWVKSGEVKQGRIVNTEETITQLALDSCSLDINPKGSVLMAMYGANIGEVGVLEIDATTNQAVCACQVYSDINTDFLCQLLVSLKQNFVLQGAGAAQPNISKEKIVHTLVPLPPLLEQRRIVARIDQLMARCDELETLRTAQQQKRLEVHTSALNALLTAREPQAFAEAWRFVAEQFSDLYSVPGTVSELRKAVLQLAVMGKLVPQDASDPPASELLEEIKAEKRRLVAAGKIRESKPLPSVRPEEQPYEVPQGWAWVQMEQLCSEITSGSTPPNHLFSETDGIPYLKVYNIRGQKIDFGYKSQYVSKEYHETKLKKSILLPGDVVMNIVGPPLGKTAIIPDDYPEFNCNQAIVFFRPVEKSLNMYIYTYI